MDTTYNKLTRDEENFFNNLKKYLDNQIIFFGSIQRDDYIQGYSDIDVVIFTDNVYSTNSKLQTYLEIPKNNIKKIVWKLQNGEIVSGYKIMYKNSDKNFSVEFSIYNEKYKRGILREHIYKSFNLPIYAVCLLYILKTLYYKFNIINKDIFKNIKKYILGPLIGLDYDRFVTLDKDPLITDKRITEVFFY